MSLQDDIIIDESAIDLEILKQAELMKKYTNLESDCKNDLDRIEEECELLYVKLDKKIRANPDKFGIEKVTEPVVKNTILLQGKYQNLRSKVLDARHELNNAKSAVRAIEVKKSALEYLVKLHGQQYFAGPSEPRNLTKELERKQKNSNNKVKIKRSN